MTQEFIGREYDRLSPALTPSCTFSRLCAPRAATWWSGCGRPIRTSDTGRRIAWPGAVGHRLRHGRIPVHHHPSRIESWHRPKLIARAEPRRFAFHIHPYGLQETVFFDV